MSIRSYFKSKETAGSDSTAVPITSKRPKRGEREDETTESVEDPSSKNPGKKAKTNKKDDDAAKSPEKGKKSDLAAAKSPEKGKKVEASSITLTPEMLEKIQKNKEQALERKRVLETNGVSKSSGKQAETLLETAELLPTSWKEVLSPELSKAYFKSLDAFVRYLDSHT